MQAFQIIRCLIKPLLKNNIQTIFQGGTSWVAQFLNNMNVWMVLYCAQQLLGLKKIKNLLHLSLSKAGPFTLESHICVKALKCKVFHGFFFFFPPDLFWFCACCFSCRARFGEALLEGRAQGKPARKKKSGGSRQDVREGGVGCGGGRGWSSPRRVPWWQPHAELLCWASTTSGGPIQRRRWRRGGAGPMLHATCCMALWAAAWRSVVDASRSSSPDGHLATGEAPLPGLDPEPAPCSLDPLEGLPSRRCTASVDLGLPSSNVSCTSGDWAPGAVDEARVALCSRVAPSGLPCRLLCHGSSLVGPSMTSFTEAPATSLRLRAVKRLVIVTTTVPANICSNKITQFCS